MANLRTACSDEVCAAAAAAGWEPGRRQRGPAARVLNGTLAVIAEYALRPTARPSGATSASSDVAPESTAV